MGHTSNGEALVCLWDISGGRPPLNTAETAGLLVNTFQNCATQLFTNSLILWGYYICISLYICAVISTRQKNISVRPPMS